MDGILAQKRCTKCGVTKPLAEFQDDKRRNGKQSWCKRCQYENLKKWRTEHREQARAQCRKWAKEHHEYSVQRAIRWNKAHPEKSSAAQDRWHKNHPERWRIAGKKTRQRYPDKIRELCRDRRARIKGNEGRFTEKEWQELLVKYGNRCLNPDCLDPTQPVTRDHVIPINKGGPNTIDNIQPLCRACNSRKHNKIIDYRK